MPLMAGRPVAAEKMELDPSKIQRYQVPANDMELHLTYWPEGRATASVSFPGFSEYSYQVKKWRSQKQAEEEFPELVEKFRRGEYSISIYDNGNVKIRMKNNH